MDNISDNYLKEQLIYSYPELDISQTLNLVERILQLRKHVSKEYLNSDKREHIHLNASIAIQFYNDEIKRLLGLI
jgi:hypothetical protein